MKFSHSLSQGMMCLALFAVSNSAQAYQGSTNNNYDPICCPPASCGGCDFGITASYLYWNVQQDFLGFGAQSLIAGPNTPSIPNHIWDSGFRLEATLSDSCSRIGYHAEWTYFKTSKNVSVIGNTSGSPIPDVAALALPIGLNNSWKVNINEFAFDIDYRLGLSSCFALRPYLGVYGATIDQKQNVGIDLSAITPDGGPSLGLISIHRKNDFSGVGPRIGFGASWNFTQQFSLAFDTNFALLIGKIKSQHETLLPGINSLLPTPIPNYIFDSNKSIWVTRPMTSAFLGLNWDGCVCRSILSLSVGYEVQYWWNQWRATESVFNQILIGGNRNGDLALNGLVASIGIKF